MASGQVDPVEFAEWKGTITTQLKVQIDTTNELKRSVATKEQLEGLKVSVEAFTDKFEEFVKTFEGKCNSRHQADAWNSSEEFRKVWDAIDQDIRPKMQAQSTDQAVTKSSLAQLLKFIGVLLAAGGVGGGISTLASKLFGG